MEGMIPVTFRETSTSGIGTVSAKSLVAGVCFGTGGTTGNENQPKGERRQGWCWDKE